MGKFLYRNNKQTVAETFVNDIGKYNDNIIDVIRNDFMSKPTLRSKITHIDKVSDRNNVLYVFSISEVEDSIRRRQEDADRFNDLFSSE